MLAGSNRSKTVSSRIQSIEASQSAQSTNSDASQSRTPNAIPGRTRPATVANYVSVTKNENKELKSLSNAEAHTDEKTMSSNSSPCISSLNTIMPRSESKITNQTPSSKLLHDSFVSVSPSSHDADNATVSSRVELTKSQHQKLAKSKLCSCCRKKQNPKIKLHKESKKVHRGLQEFLRKDEKRMYFNHIEKILMVLVPLGVQLAKNLKAGSHEYTITKCLNVSKLEVDRESCIACNDKKRTISIDTSSFNFATLILLLLVVLLMSRISAGNRIIFSMFKRGLYVRNSDKSRFIIPVSLVSLIVTTVIYYRHMLDEAANYLLECKPCLPLGQCFFIAVLGDLENDFVLGVLNGLLLWIPFFRYLYHSTFNVYHEYTFKKLIKTENAAEGLQSMTGYIHLSDLRAAAKACFLIKKGLGSSPTMIEYVTCPWLKSDKDKIKDYLFENKKVFSLNNGWWHKPVNVESRKKKQKQGDPKDICLDPESNNNTS